MLDTSRFTDRALVVLKCAKQEAIRLNHSWMGTGCLLLGLIKEGTSVACNALKNLDIDLREVRTNVEKLLRTGDSRTTDPTTTNSFNSVLDYAAEEANNINHKYIGPEHILLGLLRWDEGAAIQILKNLNATVADVREEILQHIGPEKPKSPTIVCLCGSTRFKNEFIDANFRETMAGKIVLSVGFFTHADNERYPLSNEEKKKLDELHLRKIDLAQEVLFLNVDGYMGESTKRELEYAKKHGKIIRFLEGGSG